MPSHRPEIKATTGGEEGTNKMTTTPQAALLISDLELRAIYEKHQLATADIVISDLRRILIDAQAAILAKLQATQAEPAMADEQWADATHAEFQRQFAQHPGTSRNRSTWFMAGAMHERGAHRTTQEPVRAGELPDERAAFEQWASDNGEFPRAVARSGDVYHLMATQTYWLAWQARAALSARKPLTDQGTVFDRAAKLEPKPCDQCSGTMRGSTNGYSVFLRCDRCGAVPMPSIGLEVKP